MKKEILDICSFLLALILIACVNESESHVFKPAQPAQDEIIVNTLIIKDNNGQSYQPFMVDSGNYYILFPFETNFAAVEFVANSTVPYIFDNGEKRSSGIIDISDFTKPLRCACIEENGDTVIREIVVFGQPVMTIVTPDTLPILSKTERKEGCTVKLIVPNKEVRELGTAGIRGRGNSTWLQEKKPYNVRFDKKIDILGMKKSKHWILLANAYYDRTQIHNSTAFEIARKTDFQWVPSGHHVELFLNGEYRGLYYLCEKIGAEEDKIPLKKANEMMLPSECGYLLESYVTLEDRIESFANNNVSSFFYTGIFTHTGYSPNNCFLGWEIKEPEDYLTDNHVEYIKGELTRVERLIMDSERGEYHDFFDIESAINWWLVEELCLNEEASRTKNVYMYKDGDGKFTIGPPWDFDAWTFETLSDQDRNWNLNTAFYYSKLFEDPVFKKRLQEKWNVFKPIWESEIPKYIEEQYNMIHRAAERNEIKWAHWWIYAKYPDVTYRELIDEMK